MRLRATILKLQHDERQPQKLSERFSAAFGYSKLQFERSQLMSVLKQLRKRGR